MSDTYTVRQAQANLSRLCNSKKRFIIANREKPVCVVLPLEEFDALLETMEIMSNPSAMKILKASKAGKLKYKKLNLDDENFGL